MGGGGGGGAAVPSASAAPAGGKQQGAGDPRAEALRCPRCDSANTKFCYYNNYSMAQPRHFCKACKRYWTRGGTLRNVPVGGGCRKNKRSRGGGGSGGKHCAGGGSAAAASAAVGAGPATAPASASLSLPPLPSLTSALGLPGSSLASLFLGGSGDHVSLFQAMQAVPGDAAGFELQQPQVDHLLGLGYGGSCGGVAQMQVKPWQQLQEAGGVMDAYFGPLLAGSAVPGLEELHMCKEVKVEDAGDQHKAAPAVEHWELPSCDAAIASADALISSINPAGSNTPVAPASASLMYWNSGATAWPDIGNCGSSVAPLF